MTTEDKQETTNVTAPGGWEREFVLALRLQGFDGIQISDSLAAVEARCSAASRTAFETYGNPVAYAQYVRLPPPRRTRRSSLAVAVPALGLALGINLSFDALLHWQDRVVISVGSVASVVALVLVIAVLTRLFARAIASAINLASCLAAGLVLTLLLQWALPYAIGTADPFVALALGLLLVSLGITVRRLQPGRVVTAGRH